METKVSLKGILFATLISAAASTCGGALLFLTLMQIFYLMTPPFPPTSIKNIISTMISLISISLTNPLPLEPWIPLLPGLAIGLIGGLRASRIFGLTVRAALGGIIAMLIRLFYVRRMPVPNLTEFLIILLLSVGIAQIDLGFKVLLRKVSAYVKKR